MAPGASGLSGVDVVVVCFTEDCQEIGEDSFKGCRKYVCLFRHREPDPERTWATLHSWKWADNKELI